MSFYSEYLKNFYTRHSELQIASFQTQMMALETDGFSGGHLFASSMKHLGYDTEFAVVDCIPAQCAWMAEYCSMTGSPSRSEIIKAQVDKICPDILFISDPVALNPQVLRRCNWKPRLVIAWRAAPTPNGSDWSDVDLMISSHAGCRKQALSFGAKAVQEFRPGFPNFVSKALLGVGKVFDVVFTGQVGEYHHKRIDTIKRLAGITRLQKEQGLSLFLLNPSGIALGIAEAYARPAVWGMDMFKALKQGRIVVNSHVDMALGESQNMRLYEATGVGSFLLTEYSPQLSEVFEPGVEIETYASVDEMEDKITYYLDHPDKRERIAQKGQERCLKDHGVEVRAKQLDAIIKEYL